MYLFDTLFCHVHGTRNAPAVAFIAHTFRLHRFIFPFPTPPSSGSLRERHRIEVEKTLSRPFVGRRTLLFLSEREGGVIRVGTGGHRGKTLLEKRHMLVWMSTCVDWQFIDRRIPRRVSRFQVDFRYFLDESIDRSIGRSIDGFR